MSDKLGKLMSGFGFNDTDVNKFQKDLKSNSFKIPTYNISE